MVKDWWAVMMQGAVWKCPPALGRWGGRGRGRGSVIDALASGREADNGCGMLAVLCHQTRALKDGALEYYQSSLDQDVMLSGSFSFSLSPPPQWRTLLFLPL